MLERIDELDKYYIPIEKTDKWIGRLFWVSAILSISIIYSNSIPMQLSQQMIEIFFIVVVVSHFVLSQYNSFHLIPIAENSRRKQLLSNSFNVPLIPETTEGYYNNDITPSIARLGASVFENSFFAKNVSYKMAKKERLKVLLYFLLWLIAIIFRSTDLSLVLILTQVLFSGEIFVRFIKIEILHSRNESIYNDLYAHFLHKTSSTNNEGTANLLYLFASYEAVKADASIKQSSKIFDELNPKLSIEWEEIRKKLAIDK